MRKILVAVLDWGLGHATRSIQLIRVLKECGHEVHIASSGPALDLLKLEFPHHQFFELPEYRPSYDGGKYLLIPSLIFRIPRFLKIINSEKKVIDSLVSEKNFDVIFSDNRYGCYSPKVESIFIGHQLTIPLNGLFRPLRNLISRIQSFWLKKFDQVWVPDDTSRFFSGLMGKVSGLNPIYIGPLSRFNRDTTTIEKKYFVTAIVSGPEPSRSIFSDRLEKILVRLDKPCCLITGQPERGAVSLTVNKLSIRPHLTSAELQQLIDQSTFIISRSGYSSIMDYAITGSRVVLVPTPGQPEQEYLARRFNDNNLAVTINQDKLTIETLSVGLKGTRPLDYNYDSNLLLSAIRSINFAFT